MDSGSESATYEGSFFYTLPSAELLRKLELKFDAIHFHQLGPLDRVGLVVAMCVCLNVCFYVCLNDVPFSCNFF